MQNDAGPPASASMSSLLHTSPKNHQEKALSKTHPRGVQLNQLSLLERARVFAWGPTRPTNTLRFQLRSLSLRRIREAEGCAFWNEAGGHTDKGKSISLWRTVQWGMPSGDNPFKSCKGSRSEDAATGEQRVQRSKCHLCSRPTSDPLYVNGTFTAPVNISSAA